MRYQRIDAGLFIRNRKEFSKQMKPGSIAVFVSNDLVPRSADATYKWRQDPDLYYLCGVDQEETFLILFPDAPVESWREMLFVRETNHHIKVWEGEKLTIADAQQVSGIRQVNWSRQFEAMLHLMMSHAQTVYLNLNEHDRFSETAVEYASLRFARSLQKKYPLHNYTRSQPVLSALRRCKTAWEIEAMQQAIDITDAAFRRLLRFVRPGVWEFEIEAELIHEYIRQRGTGHAYEPIIAGGENACILHYNQNNKQCVAGEVLLLDSGAEYGMYNADLSRSIPVSGRFTPRQKAVYQAVLRVMKGARELMRPGITLQALNEEAGKMMEKELLQLKLLSKTDIKQQSAKNPAYKKYFPHGTAHFLGLDVHDVGSRYEKLKAGCVLTCEPGIYIPEEKLGIRLENNILVTNGKPRDLMANIPIEVEEIESLMSANKKK
jgi:Xaa-Pro aminopeptidase